MWDHFTFSLKLLVLPFCSAKCSSSLTVRTHRLGSWYYTVSVLTKRANFGKL